MQEQETTKERNEALCSWQAATVGVAASTQHQFSVPVLQVDSTPKSAAMPTECSPKKAKIL